jgi:hypothetical protein
MNGNGQGDASVLCWPRRVLSADDLRRHLTSQRELQLLPRTVVTPLAADELKARGVRISWQAAKPAAANEPSTWGYAHERPDSALDAALAALARDGVKLTRLDVPDGALWKIAKLTCPGVVVFCGDPGTLCCIANKQRGVRAIAVATPQAAVRARQTLGPNLVAIEMPGRTFFELRQILRAICSGAPTCPTELATTLKELDGHAHR